MASPHNQVRPGDDGTNTLQRRHSQTVTQADVASRNRRNDESWVEVVSQPSSSSLSSIGDEIVTTGLRVGAGSYPPRRRRLRQQQQHQPLSYTSSQTAIQTSGTSSQEEYDETESEEDHVLTSSTENVQMTPSLTRQQITARPPAASDSEDDDDDENATALGRPSNSPTFRPQPNAFSHPPSHLTHRNSTSSSASQHASYRRPSLSGRPQMRHARTGPNFMSPSSQADNDAALRASLTTLLSCAAAARGLPKKDDVMAGTSRAGAGVLPSSQPMELRLVPESELMEETPTSGPAQVVGPRLRQGPGRTASNSSAPSAPSSISSRATTTTTAEKNKRAAATQSRPSSRAVKKKRTTSSGAEGETTAAFISPTLMTLVVSAGVVVLVSVVGFGAGYVIGREVGRQEGALGVGVGSSGATANATTCGSDLVRSTGSGGGLRRFRWGGVGRSVIPA